MSGSSDKPSMGPGISSGLVDEIFAGLFRDEDVKRKARMEVMLARHYCRFHCPSYSGCLTAMRNET